MKLSRLKGSLLVEQRPLEAGRVAVAPYRKLSSLRLISMQFNAVNMNSSYEFKKTLEVGLAKRGHLEECLR